MNKNILIGLALTASFTLCAQTFPDGSFEKIGSFSPILILKKPIIGILKTIIFSLR
jgi:hypothetical protein